MHREISELKKLFESPHPPSLCNVKSTTVEVSSVCRSLEHKSTSDDLQSCLQVVNTYSKTCVSQKHIIYICTYTHK